MWSFAIQNILSRPVRTILSVLSLTVAIAGMVGLYSIAGGIETVVTSTFRLIPGLLVQQRGAPVPIFSSLFPAAWEEELEVMPGVAVVNPEIIARVNVINGKTIISPPRFLVGLEIESRLRLANGVYSQFVKAGRFLESSDRGTNHAIISRPIADEFEVGLDDTLMVNGTTLEVVGIYESGSLLLDVNVLCDIETVRRITRYDPDSVSVYYIEQDGTVDDRTLARNIEERFRDRLDDTSLDLSQLISPGTSSLLPNSVQGVFQMLEMASSLTGMAGGEPQLSESIDPGDSDEHSQTETDSDNAEAGEPEPSPIEVRSADDWTERFQEMSADLDLFLGIMTTIGVVIAVISIINTMLMSVAERTIEFGILRANGWSRRDLLKLITAESSLIGVAGGVLGAFFGWLATLVLNQIWPDRLHLYATPTLLAFSVVFATLLGLIGGLYPAWLAGRMVPMDAIRRG